MERGLNGAGVERELERGWGGFFFLFHFFFPFFFFFLGDSSLLEGGVWCCALAVRQRQRAGPPLMVAGGWRGCSSRLPTVAQLRRCVDIVERSAETKRLPSSVDLVFFVFSVFSGQCRASPSERPTDDRKNKETNQQIGLANSPALFVVDRLS